MKLKSRWVGLLILLCVALSAFALDRIGRERQPKHFTIMFKSGSQLESSAKPLIEKIASMMATTDSYEAIIVGHSGTRGNPAVNKELSQKRAELVKRRLVDNGVSPDRIQTFGVGGQDPLDKRPDEGQRSYYQRLKRAEVTLKRP